MKQMLLAASALCISLCSAPLLAQSCTGTPLNGAGILAALGGKWACAVDGADMWNEKIGLTSAGTFAECHSGLATGPDPIDNNKGTYVITSGQSPDTITYTYPPSGGSAAFRVNEVTAGSTYNFCRVSDNKVFVVRITTCPPPTLNACP